jgi:two-component system sensor histidine kinase TctE
MSAEVVSSGSIRRRLTLQLVAGAAILASLLFLLVQNFARQIAVESQDSVLQASASSILESVSVQAGAVTADIPYAALSMLGTMTEDRVFYRILRNDQVLTGYADLPPPGPLLPGVPVYDTAAYLGEPVRVAHMARRVSVGGVPVTVTVSVAQTQSGLAARLDRISNQVIVLGLGFFAAAAILAVLAAQSSIRPIQALAGAVARRGPEDLRPVTAPVPAEMTTLVSALNGFIARLRASLARSEDLISEAAHRVRTPLATVRAQAELALRRVERPENRASLKEMIRAIDDSSRAAGQLMDHAMVSFRSDRLSRERIDLAALLDEVAERFRAVAGMKDIEIRVDAPPGPVIGGDPVLLQNAITNLLDNAMKYSPAETAIDVTLRTDAGRAQIAISDQGPGLPDPDGTDLTERFTRGANAGGTVGSGLGLTIAKEVAAAHGGALILANREEPPGACVTLSLPLSA